VTVFLNAVGNTSPRWRPVLFRRAHGTEPGRDDSVLFGCRFQVVSTETIPQNSNDHCPGPHTSFFYVFDDFGAVGCARFVDSDYPGCVGVDLDDAGEVEESRRGRRLAAKDGCPTISCDVVGLSALRRSR